VSTKEHEGSTERLGNESDVAEKRERLSKVTYVTASPTDSDRRLGGELNSASRA
jgi:hypothetical protein